MLDSKCIIAFQMAHIEKHYTTKQIFDYFNVFERKDITDTGQHMGGIRIMKNNQETRSIIQLEYDTYKANKLLVTDCYNNSQEPYFIDNRHEQSIFSVITKLNNNVMVLKDETDVSNRKIRKNFPFFASRIKDRNLHRFHRR